MPYVVKQFQPTPNPNALKCVLDKSPAPAPSPPRSYARSAGVPSPDADALAHGLFSIGGVTNILIHDGWVSVVKTPDADWKAIKAEVSRVLGAQP
jgi:hypothetical protein